MPTYLDVLSNVLAWLHGFGFSKTPLFKLLAKSKRSECSFDSVLILTIGLFLKRQTFRQRKLIFEVDLYQPDIQRGCPGMMRTHPLTGQIISNVALKIWGFLIFPTSLIPSLFQKSAFGPIPGAQLGLLPVTHNNALYPLITHISGYP